MLSKLFDSHIRVRTLRSSPAGKLLNGFAGALTQAGYAKITARRHVRAAEHFVSWTVRKRVSLTEVSRDTVSAFARHVHRCRCGAFGRSDASLVHGVSLFVRYLEKQGAVRISPIASPSADLPLLAAFRAWMRRQRGTSEATLANYALPIRALLKCIGEDPRKLDARTLRQFVMEASRTSGWSAATRTTALRMFLRFLIAEGKCDSRLDGAVPTLAHWRLSTLPRYLPESDVERLIASCDAQTPVGKRDRAMLLLLARLGLRAGDIVRLRLDDIDWRNSCIRVSGKGRRETRLPLTHEVGRALSRYVASARPPVDERAVFLTMRAPFRPFGSHCAVSVTVDRALRRSGVKRPSRGAAHLLRHSVATAMLRHGASLRDVATVLRHRSIATTQIYAKVDVTALQTIAQPWPEGQPC